MGRIIIYLILISLMISCKGQNLDLATIDFNKSADRYSLETFNFFEKEEQKGHWKINHIKDSISLKLEDNGERVISYSFIGDDNAAKNINYEKLLIDPILGVSISVYDNRVVYMGVNIQHEETFKLLTYLLEKLGNPTEIIENTTTAISEEGWNLLEKNIPQYVKQGKSDWGSNIVYYPQYFIWVKDGIIYQLTLMPVAQFVSNNLVIISKKAIKDRIILGYHVGDRDILLGKYLK